MIELTNISNFEALFKCIDQCSGRVELVSEDMCVNLKSKLAQYFSIAKLCADGEIKSMKLRTYDENDQKLLMDFMINGDGLA